MTTQSNTHLGCRAGARMAELSGASEGDICRLGQWISQALAGCYSTQLPRVALHTIADFLLEAGSYFLNRDAVTPNQDLQDMIFPWTLKWKIDGNWDKTLAVQG